MGVIRWRKVFGADFGEVGNCSICRVTDFLTGWKLELYPAFPGIRAGQLIYDEADLRFKTKAFAKEYAESLLQEWLDAAGLARKSDYDDLLERYRKLNISLGDRYLEIRDLVDENAVLKERIGSAFGDIDDAITALKRKVDDIVADTGVARAYSWDVPIDEWWKGNKPKLRTETDFRNADIDANGYVTFRDGGAA